MGALDVELASLRERLSGKPANDATLRRRIAEIEAIIATAPEAAEAAPVIEAAVEMEVETATLPKAKRGSRS